MPWMSASWHYLEARLADSRAYAASRQSSTGFGACQSRSLQDFWWGWSPARCTDWYRAARLTMKYWPCCAHECSAWRQPTCLVASYCSRHRNNWQRATEIGLHFCYGHELPGFTSFVTGVDALQYCHDHRLNSVLTSSYVLHFTSKLEVVQYHAFRKSNDYHFDLLLWRPYYWKIHHLRLWLLTTAKPLPVTASNVI